MTDTLSPQNAAVIGPKPKGLVCQGCPAFRTNPWREPSGDGETYDNGSYAWCDAADHRSMGAYHYPTSPTPDWCPARTEPPKPAPSAEGVERLARLLCRQHYGDRGYSLPAIAKVTEEDWPGWVEKAEEVFAALPVQSVTQAETVGEPVAVPAGWRLVPDYPTVDMLAAYCRQMNTGTQEIGEHREDGRYQVAAYQAMIAAAPPSPGPETGVEISEEVSSAPRCPSCGVTDDDHASDCACQPLSAEDSDAWDMAAGLILKEDGQ